MLRSVSSLFLINATCRVRATFDLLQMIGCLFSVFSVSAMCASLSMPSSGSMSSGETLFAKNNRFYRPDSVQRHRRPDRRFRGGQRLPRGRRLRPWQPRFDFLFRVGAIKKSPLPEADRILRCMVKGWLNLPPKKTTRGVLHSPFLWRTRLSLLVDLADIIAMTEF